MATSNNPKPKPMRRVYIHSAFSLLFISGFVVSSHLTTELYTLGSIDSAINATVIGMFHAFLFLQHFWISIQAYGEYRVERDNPNYIRAVIHNAAIRYSEDLHHLDVSLDRGELPLNTWLSMHDDLVLKFQNLEQSKNSSELKHNLTALWGSSTANHFMDRSMYTLD